ncbi:endoplasmic reticulum EF hand protein [Schizosaccharomyces pombe]|uniref:Uncharacterized calcium-binding protein C613.03 n=1 Tax=Schizosaccharomyces pombe (strain 972 / ATCC 24843) TaxID=284812 RepID=YCS3_SCHPO|nr:uncharacterized protein SPCC613.03 [Schizosaccharomyces pombe]O74903.1 RecName: Full=Uncharacterized calcium-binding protein C613.03; Flags: Precursor [Schizosaccharomyces pombe 972h-]CAA21055.1 conserved fungal protein [Schizosaccharomyces pombe]|eukprot:NP_587691.1 uncharacterized protein SPCC613.03 [Schizosaccharomyces pombe]
MKFSTVGFLFSTILFKSAFAGWMDTHMKDEHHIDKYTDESFFRLHDLGKKGYWSDQDILSLYGLFENDEVPFVKKNEVLVDVLKKCDPSGNRRITLDEFLAFRKNGGELTDFGFPGHHGDEEEEFEMHHVEKYHPAGLDEPDENWNHPEDIEHFQKHDEIFHGDKKPEERRKHFVKYNNIPDKYRRVSI